MRASGTAARSPLADAQRCAPPSPSACPHPSPCVRRHRYRKAVLFVDNSGADVILGERRSGCNRGEQSHAAERWLQTHRLNALVSLTVPLPLPLPLPRQACSPWRASCCSAAPLSSLRPMSSPRSTTSPQQSWTRCCRRWVGWLCATTTDAVLPCRRALLRGAQSTFVSLCSSAGIGRRPRAVQGHFHAAAAGGQQRQRPARARPVAGEGVGRAGLGGGMGGLRRRAWRPPRPHVPAFACVSPSPAADDPAPRCFLLPRCRASWRTRQRAQTWWCSRAWGAASRQTCTRG